MHSLHAYSILLFVALLLIGDNNCLDILAQVDCEVDSEGYISPDPIYCDRYMECSPDGKKSIKTCDLGQKFDLNIAECNYEDEVECKERIKTWRVDHVAERISRPKLKPIFSTRTKPAVLGTTPTTSTTFPPPVQVSTSTSSEPESDIVVPHDPLNDIECQGSDVYVVPDPSHCDRFLLCPDGNIEICDVGFSLDTFTGFCESRSSVNCGDRHLNFRDNQQELEAKLEQKILSLISSNPETPDISFEDSNDLGNLEDDDIDSFIEDSIAPPASSDKISPTTTTTEASPKFSSILDPKPAPKLSLSIDTTKNGGIDVLSSTAKKTLLPSIEVSGAKSQILDNSAAEVLKDSNTLKSVVFGQRLVGRAKFPSPNQEPSISVKSTGPVKVKDVPRKDSSKAGSRLFLVDNVLCEVTAIGYKVPDAEQCDKYAECFNGVKTILLCPDGFAFDLRLNHCDYLTKVNCSSRPKLQPPKSTRLCPRENGYYPMATEVSCSQYIDCRNGVGHILGCGAGAVFDEVKGCVHPDETDRPGCTAEDMFNFKCPSSGLTQRFGDHDRLPHPTDCSLFYACLRNGSPRLLSCQKPTVFNPQSGLCEHQDHVPGCQDFYSAEELLLHPAILEESERLAQEIREQILSEFNLLKRK